MIEIVEHLRIVTFPFFLLSFFFFFGLRLLKKKKRKGKRKISHGNGQEKHIGLMAFQHAYYMILYIYLFMGKYSYNWKRFY